MRAVDKLIYDRIHAEWWSDDSFMALLRTAVNPPRFDYFRRALTRRFGPMAGAISVLDVGCGGGLLTEGFASLGCRVTGLDRSLPTLAAARAHATQTGHDIRYLQGDAADLPFDDGSFDVVCCCDVLEHVDDVDRVAGEIARTLKPEGLFFFDTINRTWRSKLLAIKLAQDWPPTRVIPKDVHVWEKFIRPDELAASLSRHGLTVQAFAGLAPRDLPAAALALLRLKLGLISFGTAGAELALGPSDDLSVSYMGSATRDAAPALHDEKKATMRVLIGGGSGFIGRALTTRFRERGDEVTWISRTAGAGRITWEDVERGAVPRCDVVVHLAGQHILDLRRVWNDAYRREVLESRLRTTKALVAALNAMAEPPAVFVSTAGKCFYGTAEIAADRSYPRLDESSPPMAVDFPAELVAQWEHAANRIDSKRIRHVSVRIGVVLGEVVRGTLPGRLWRIGRGHGFLPLIRLPFCLGVGAVMGHGRQPVPWIHVDDAVGVIEHVIDQNDARGRYNAVAPGVVSNRQFTQALARRLRRPVVWAAPAWLVRRVVGGDRASILLEGQNVFPRRTLESGYRFRYPFVGPALADLVHITV